jgi:hypothetical protein
MHRSAIDPDLAVLAQRGRTLVVAVTTSGSIGQSDRALLDACQRAGVATRIVTGSADVIALVPRVGTVDRILVFGGPVETTVLHIAMQLGAQARTVGIIWDATHGDSALTLDVTRDRATQAGVIPYTLAACMAELGLSFTAATSPRRYSEVA